MFSLFSFVNSTKLDQSKVHLNSHLPVYITMTTIPSRMKNTFKIINHFLQHVTGLEKVILNIPYSYKRWPGLSIDVGVAASIKDARFVLNRCEDYGPLTKILPSLNIIPNNSITIIADDMCYTHSAFQDIVEKQTRDLKKAFSYYVYPFSSGEGEDVHVPQGADLISTWTQNYQYLHEFIERFHQENKISLFDSPCFYVDDQVLAWYFKAYGIPLEQVDRTHRMIYRKNCAVADTNDNLNKQTGERSRDTTMDGCYTLMKKFV